MSYDLNLIVLNESGISQLSTMGEVEIRTENVRYFEIWPILNGLTGSWYSLGKNSDVDFCAYELIEELPTVRNTIKYPFWIDKEEEGLDYTPYKFSERYKENIKQILELLISKSPCKIVLILARVQGKDLPVIYGAFSLNQFWAMMEKGQIQLNICYIIQE